MPVVLDLFCGEGGAAQGYVNAGFDVVGIDINHKTNPTAVKKFNERFDGTGTFARKLDWLDGLTEYIDRVDLVHASPPCQLYSVARGGRTSDEHPDYIYLVQQELRQYSVPYVIENVAGAKGKLNDPKELCGCMFGLTVEYATPRNPGTPKKPRPLPADKVPQFRTDAPKPIARDCGCEKREKSWKKGVCNPDHLVTHTYMLRRPRYFEAGSWSFEAPTEYHNHNLPNMPVTGGNPSSFYYVNGSFPIDPDKKRELMQCTWMSDKGVAEAIPPAFTKYIGEQFKIWVANGRKNAYTLKVA